ncbi:MAG: uridine diphosphate-N-acetylglucosamine-binding protein YvcK, partial [Actinomycetota bacterium]|nr:uridine diphosphate-N-acetylglucosamine-binding protein YvcK [Actinomycetota bacterium]
MEEADIKIVGVGGGTGLSNLLRGIKLYTNNITAIVTVTDDGGSSGRLREDFNMLPPGDIRNCIVSLAESDSLLSELFQYRFKGRSGLSGHSFGNLFIAAMTNITGSFAKGILEASSILSIKGKVLPSTLENVILGAIFEDGAKVLGQTKIINYPGNIKEIFLEPSSPPAYTGVLRACKEADAIVLGPGSLFSSIIPNLLVKGVAKTISQSKAKKIYICNIMTQPGETDNFTVKDHVYEIERYLKSNIDYLIVNSSLIPKETAARYAEKNSYVVFDDTDKLPGRINIIRENVSLNDV